MAKEKDPRDQRITPRIDYDVSVDFSSEDNFFTGFIKNISSGGLFLATHDPAPIGSDITVKFEIPTIDEKVIAKSVVRWVRPYRDSNPDIVPGMGVQFKDVLPENAVDAINKFIEENREPEFYEE